MRRWLVLGLVGAALITGMWYGAAYLLSLRNLTVTFTHIQNVKIYKTSSLNAGRDNAKPSKTIVTSGQTVKIPKGDYTAYYTGQSGYDSRYQQFELSDKHQTLKLTAGFSESKLNATLNAEFNTIKAAIAQKYPLVSLYTIQKGKLYEDGSWYGTTLVYNGPYSFNSDTLRIVLHKEDGQWVTKTNPPNITLSKYQYPDIPESILRDVNAQ